MPLHPTRILAFARGVQAPRRVSRWAAQPIAVRRGLHVVYFAGYAVMAVVAALAILVHR